MQVSSWLTNRKHCGVSFRASHVRYRVAAPRPAFVARASFDQRVHSSTEGSAGVLHRQPRGLKTVAGIKPGRTHPHDRPSSRAMSCSSVMQSSSTRASIKRTERRAHSLSLIREQPQAGQKARNRRLGTHRGHNKQLDGHGNHQ